MSVLSVKLKPRVFRSKNNINKACINRPPLLIGDREGMMATWLVHSTPDRLFWVQALADCVVFLGKTIYFHSAPLHSRVQMGTGEFNAEGNPAMD